VRSEKVAIALIVQVWFVLPIVRPLPVLAGVRPLTCPTLQLVVSARVSPDGLRYWRDAHRFEIKPN
jgi:hypothetical protein